MTSTDSSLRPPRFAAWCVELFTSPHEADGVLGDLAEEFHASLAVSGETEARRRYRRDALRTIRDLAWAPWQRNGATRFSATGTAIALGIIGLACMWPINWGVSAVARELVVRYEVYSIVPARMFWMSQAYLSMVLSGIVLALLARGARMRPMSIALSALVVFALVSALDRPIMVWLYGQPEAKWAQITVLSTLTRVGVGLLAFGAPLVFGVVVGRKLPLESTRVRPTSI